eukprot:CAMPEP_0119389018 /NCGR_PEP_ID=MMETSP1334-20130426/107386_1 /TAXON_ID=127549 /ORGANISM="Calcidiscus leptoporus, Strain RCC1130" /LENGTH=71 /DNA_ID=CAMNT_0007411153 /DNA_START=185 /DNA_END=400 /DNA_ORIENTATION=-
MAKGKSACVGPLASASAPIRAEPLACANESDVTMYGKTNLPCEPSRSRVSGPQLVIAPALNSTINSRIGVV